MKGIVKKLFDIYKIQTFLQLLQGRTEDFIQGREGHVMYKKRLKRAKISREARKIFGVPP